MQNLSIRLIIVLKKKDVITKETSGLFGELTLLRLSTILTEKHVGRSSKQFKLDGALKERVRKVTKFKFIRVKMEYPTHNKLCDCKH